MYSATKDVAQGNSKKVKLLPKRNLFIIALIVASTLTSISYFSIIAKAESAARQLTLMSKILHK